MKHTITGAYALILLVALSRLFPHPPGFTPVGALGLFSGAYVDRRYAWALPLLALLIGDFFLGFYVPLIMLSVYAGFAAAACIGRVLLARKRSLPRLGAAIFSSALLFFIITNGASWWVYYPHTWGGLLACYINGLPYFGVMLAADSFYCAILFGAYEGLKRHFSGERAPRLS